MKEKILFLKKIIFNAKALESWIFILFYKNGRLVHMMICIDSQTKINPADGKL